MKTKLASSLIQKVEGDLNADIADQIEEMQTGEAGLHFYDCADGTSLGVYVFRMRSDECAVMAENYEKLREKAGQRIGLLVDIDG